MAVQELNKWIIILSRDLPTNLSFNYILIVESEYADSIVAGSIINSHLTIYLQESQISKRHFYEELFIHLQATVTELPWYIFKSDEKILAKVYKEYGIVQIKKWFFTIEKVIDKNNDLSLDKEILETINFEVTVYNQSPTKNKKSNNFYFVELLLQLFEQKIYLSLESNITSVNQNIVETNEKTPDVAKLLKETDYKLCFEHIFPASEQEYEESKILIDQLQRKLQEKGITNIYSYQHEAMRKILAGNDIVITAPTGNGKTESFLLPILQKIIEWKSKDQKGIQCIIFYPTKALASDQLAKIVFFCKDTGIKVVQLDSDVTKEEREYIYYSKEYDILITTPDMIHYSLHKNEFREFLAATKILVFDEIHIYTGTFGTHIYYFLRRLEKILNAGPKVQYIAASATIANPVEFTSKLFNRHTINVDCKTPKKNTTELYCVQRNKKTSKYDAIFQLIIQLTQSSKDEKIIVFRNSQQEAEKTFEKLRLIKNKKIALHRAGLSKDQRVRIEKQLRENEIDVVVTTTTLEVGIDIGGITTIITPIVPVNRLLQRIGRAGRGNQIAKIFLELEHDPISYYYSNHADSYLKDISPVNISTENESIARLHRELEERGCEQKNSLFSLRNVNEQIEVKTEKGYKVTEKDLPYAFYEYYPFAQLLQNSKAYQVERMERTEKQKIIAIVKPINKPFDYKLKLRPIIAKKIFTNKQSVKVDYIGNVQIKLSECRIQLEYQGNLINYKEQVLTDSYTYEYDSKCVILNFEDLMEEMIQEERTQGVDLGSIVHTLSHVLYKAAKMKIYCGNDLTNMENSIGRWKIVYVDNAINGNGMSELFYEKREEIWKRAMKIMKDCNCEKKEGCIKCTMNYGCIHKNRYLLKTFTLKK